MAEQRSCGGPHQAVHRLARVAAPDIGADAAPEVVDKIESRAADEDRWPFAPKIGVDPLDQHAHTFDVAQQGRGQADDMRLEVVDQGEEAGFGGVGAQVQGVEASPLQER